MKKRIHLCLAKMSDTKAEQHYIQEAFDTNWVAPLGPNVDAFEKDLEGFVGHNKHVAALSSCTAALHLALLALGIGKGDEVLCQSFTFCASCNPVTYCGAVPVFIDSEPGTWNIDPILLEQAIKDRIAKTGRKPKAVVVVDLYGMPAEWDALEAIGKEYDIPLIEDAANAMGAFYNGRPCGSFGTLATFSFNGNKIITTGGGGALLCNNLKTKKRIVFLATQARKPMPFYHHEDIGFNYRMSNISAGIGRGQMSVLDDHVAHHRHVHEAYLELLNDIEGIEVHGNPDGRYNSNFWLTTITIDPKMRFRGQENVGSFLTDCQPNPNVEALCVILDQAGVEARPLWKPMHKQPVYKDAPAYVNGVSESLFKTGMCLPSGPYVSDDDVRYIVGTIKEAIS